MKRIFVTVFSSLLVISAFADSPLTSTPFYQAYNEIPIIFKASQKGVLTNEFAQYLSSPAVSIDKKAALINALGWDVDGKNNNFLYYTYLKNKYKKDSLLLTDITADEHFCVVYLGVMDDYLHPENWIDHMLSAWEKNNKSYTINIIAALVSSQICLDLQWLSKEEKEKRKLDTKKNYWGELYKICAMVEASKDLKQDFRTEAKRIIFSYINLYEQYCPQEDLVLIPSTDYLSELTSNEVKLVSEDGIYKVPLKINDSFVLNFIFDSGASDVVISEDVATVLIKMGQLTKEDFTGVASYRIADGSTVQSPTIIIRKLQIGNIVVNNVKASIGGKNAPLLLGQTFQRKFEKFTINNSTHTISLVPAENQKDN